MTELNVSHATEVALLASLVGGLAIWFWKRCPYERVARLALGYAVGALAVAAVLLALILMERGGMGSSLAPIVEALSHLEVDLKC